MEGGGVAKLNCGTYRWGHGLSKKASSEEKNKNLSTKALGSRFHDLYAKGSLLFCFFVYCKPAFPSELCPSRIVFILKEARGKSAMTMAKKSPPSEQFFQTKRCFELTQHQSSSSRRPRLFASVQSPPSPLSHPNTPSSSVYLSHSSIISDFPWDVVSLTASQLWV